jgi:hypothetical protein
MMFLIFICCLEEDGLGLFRMKVKKKGKAIPVTGREGP